MKRIFKELGKDRLNDSELGNTLEIFGLSPQEADLVITLAKIHKSGVKWISGTEIAKAAGKDRVRTYQILHRLRKMGLIQTNLEIRPKKYSAVSPPIAVRRLMSVHEAKVTQLSHIEQKATEALFNVSPLKVDLLKSDQDGQLAGTVSNVTLIQGLPNIQTQLKKLMSGQKHLYLMVSDESFTHVLATLSLIDPEPADIRVIISSAKNKLRSGQIRDRLNKYQSMHVTFPLPTVILTSDQYALPFYNAQRYEKGILSPKALRTRVSDCIIVSNQSAVKQMNQLYRLCWQAALHEKVKSNRSPVP
jgi:sugar-specific transcriptional regulator TrmB